MVNSERRRGALGSGIPRSKKLFLFALPFLAIVFIFSYLPLYGWIYAFFDYKPGFPLSESEFVGVKHFTDMFSNPVQRGEMFRVMRNTLAMSAIGLLSAPLPMIFALFLMEIPSNKYRKMVQTATTLPNFISWVLMFSVVYAIFSLEDGFVNRFLMTFGLVEQPINFMGSSDNVWFTMWAYQTVKTLGWSAIMYISAMAGIDQELYEAADIDGAGRFMKMRYISVPGVMPTFFVLLLLSIGNLINNGMEQYLVFSNAMNREYIEVLDLYVYNTGLRGANYSYATAIGMLKSIISVILLMGANALSRRVRDESII